MDVYHVILLATSLWLIVVCILLSVEIRQLGRSADFFEPVEYPDRDAVREYVRKWNPPGDLTEEATP